MSRRLPTLTPRKVIQALERGGFVLHRIRGAHHYFTHPDNPALLVIVPHHPRDIKRGTLHSIIKQTGLAVEKFLELL
ncbi:MAG: type II toxin-antitoxin system HicA family toxin [bacterium]|nr:type II toxin-antitoxin system HicA family toxin [bacterium]